MDDLTQKKCIPCEGYIAPLGPEDVQKYMEQIDTSWNVIQNPTQDNFPQKIDRLFTFNDFVEAIAFINKVADIAEVEGHHPDISIHYNKVTITLWTHAIKGLSENDFILAAKIDRLEN
jgi:4a-hydroxytetrahydrobiopterin dehydratase